MSFLNQFFVDKPQDDTLHSVIRNLSYLFNSKTGYGSPLCAFGLADYYAQQGTRAAAESVMRQMLADIAAYEPRLRPRSLKVISDGKLPFLFDLQAELRVAEWRPLTLQSTAKPCRLAILFDPFQGAVHIEVADVR